jgi:hypothetical protein
MSLADSELLLLAESCDTWLKFQVVSIKESTDETKETDPLNHTKQHQVFLSDIGFRVVSCDLVDRSFTYRHEGRQKKTRSRTPRNFTLSLYLIYSHFLTQDFDQELTDF